MSIENLQRDPDKLGGRGGFESATDKAAEYRENVSKRADALKARYPEEVGWIENIVRSIDFTELKSVFLELTSKSSLADEDVNFVPPQDIFVVPPGLIRTEGGLAAFMLEQNVMLVPAQEMLEMREKRGDVHTRQVILYNLVHEYCHAVGANRAEQGPFKGRTDADLREETAAYAKMQTLIKKDGETEQVIDSGNSFVLFNEGITDEIAHRVLEKYLSRKEFFGITASNLLDKEKEGLFSSAPHMSVDYRTARTFADMLVDRISKLCEMPKDVVWNAVIGDYFRGIGLSKDLLDEIIGRGFTYNLGESRSASDLKELAKYFNFPDPRPGAIERLKSYLRGGITAE